VGGGGGFTSGEAGVPGLPKKQEFPNRRADCKDNQEEGKKVQRLEKKTKMVLGDVQSSLNKNIRMDLLAQNQNYSFAPKPFWDRRGGARNAMT